MKMLKRKGLLVLFTSVALFMVGCSQETTKLPMDEQEQFVSDY